ncbi:hypothetical protein HN992_01740 [Candidatus Woesearchaeota archaeon]|jgi:hypothetical protein|nr:hypothetical protein [Candidatus Woesearchaeota archaeon]MBT3438605.1 hypothetical protein [Candidatus Woesearchaeota archaeon]MBT4058497.1 hypothetical protein [Candidatus Woesearchaeota archaeon]MBT4207290.1 hypothetical protein [Candidatus Woesearchaeota archaeon]MBT4733188.1 hypothetical protein [Candidatus Woesearchaeota archaeon]
MSFVDGLLAFKEYFVSVVLPRFMEMVIVTIRRKETLEILIPLLITMFLVQIYFGRNKDESISWDSAYGNCIVLLFVTAHLATFVYNEFGLTGFEAFGTVAFYKTMTALAVAVVAFSLMFIDFFHTVDEKFSFFLSSSIFLSVFSFVAVVLVYSNIPFDGDTMVTSLFILLFVSTFFKVFRLAIPGSSSAQRYIEGVKRERNEKVRLFKQRINYRLTKTKFKIKKFFNKPGFE